MSDQELRIEKHKAGQDARCRACGTALYLYAITAPGFDADGVYASHMVEFYVCELHARQLGAAILGETM